MVSKGSSELSVPTILVIDDDLSLLARLGTVLEQAGYHVLKMSAVKPAEIALEEHHPDLVLLEVRVGEGAGWQVLKCFATRLPVIVLSAQGREEDIVQGLAAGAVDYIAKPYRTAELLARIELRLNHRGANQQANPAPRENNHEDEAQEGGGGAALAAASEQPAAEAAAIASSSVSAESSDDVPPHPTTPAVEAAAEDETGRPEGNGATTEAPAFMAENEDIALLRAHTTASPATSLDDAENLPEDMSLGRRLYMARRRRRVTLVQAENEIKISMAYLQAMEEEKFSMLPRGTLAAQMLRSYATFLGLDVHEAMQEYEHFYSTQAVEPVFGGGRRFSLRRMLPGWLVRLSAVVLALAVSGVVIFFFDPEGLTTLSENVRGIVLNTTPTPSPTTPAQPSPTVKPSPTVRPSPPATPRATRTPTLSPTRSPARSRPYTPMSFRAER